MRLGNVADEIRNLMSYGFNNAEIAKMTGQHRVTVQRYAGWLRREYKRMKEEQHTQKEQQGENVKDEEVGR
jgi:DNA invertase Pin-like site-specific DNA recombinase